MHPDTQAANLLLQRNLLGAKVESFGLSHQFLYIEFRDDTPEDHTLSIDTEIFPGMVDFNCQDLTDDEVALLLINRVNLKAITSIQCTDSGTLTINFDNDRSLTFSGQPSDKSCIEPWTVTKGDSTKNNDYYSIIAFSGGGYAIWDGKADLL